jgi:hypothetical protein
MFIAILPVRIKLKIPTSKIMNQQISMELETDGLSLKKDLSQFYCGQGDT